MSAERPIDKIIVLGASSGGIEAMCSLLEKLPDNFQTPLLIVQHIPGAKTTLPQFLALCGPLRVLHPKDAEPIRPGRISVAPPNEHLLVHDGNIKLTFGPRENRNRPAVDPLFRSAAR